MPSLSIEKPSKPYGMFRANLNEYSGGHRLIAIPFCSWLICYSQEQDIAEGLDALMEAADVDPAKQYAVNKIGRIVTRETRTFFQPMNSPNGMPLWTNSTHLRLLDEQKRRSGRRAKMRLTILRPNSRDFRLCFRFFLRNAHQIQKRVDLNRFVAFFYATKTLKSLQASDALFELKYGEDAMTLARSIFENYLQILFAVRDPANHSTWCEFRFGLKLGTHEYATNKNGTLDFSRIKETASGKVAVAISAQPCHDSVPLKRTKSCMRFFTVTSPCTPIPIRSYSTIIRPHTASTPQSAWKVQLLTF